MPITFEFTDSFEAARTIIEDHLYNSVFSIQKDEAMALNSIETFSKSINRLCDILEQMYQSSKANDLTGEKSFPIHGGRYRVFYKITVKESSNLKIIFTDIDDNKQSNLDRFPQHKIITFDNDED